MSRRPGADKFDWLGGRMKPGPFLRPLFVDDTLEARTLTLRQAHTGDTTALATLWKRWRCRLPIVEERTGWRPPEGPAPSLEEEPLCLAWWEDNKTEAD